MESLKYLVSLVNDVLGMNKLQSGDLKDLSNIMDNAIKFSQAGSVLMVGVKEEFLPLTVTRSKFLCVTDNWQPIR